MKRTVFFVDDCSLIVSGAAHIIEKCAKSLGLNADTVNLVPCHIQNEETYQHALEKVMQVYKETKNIRLIMDYHFNKAGIEKTGGDFVNECFKQGLPEEVIMILSVGFDNYSSPNGRCLFYVDPLKSFNYRTNSGLPPLVVASWLLQ